MLSSLVPVLASMTYPADFFFRNTKHLNHLLLQVCRWHNITTQKLIDHHRINLQYLCQPSPVQFFRFIAIAAASSALVFMARLRSLSVDAMGLVYTRPVGQTIEFGPTLLLPMLPVEFAGQSSHGRITIALAGVLLKTSYNPVRGAGEQTG